MSTPLSVTVQAATPLEISNLGLRPDDPLSFALIIKVMLVLVVLLTVAYVLLRWYSRRGQASPQTGQLDLHCVAALRLSTKTKVYLLQSAGTNLLITEAATGSTVTLLPSAVSPVASQPDKSSQCLS